MGRLIDVWKGVFDMTNTPGFTLSYADSNEKYGAGLMEGSCVDAIYTHAVSSRDKGNPLIEALPIPPDEDSIRTMFMRGLPDFDHKEVVSLPPYEQKQLVDDLNSLRFPLPYYKQVADGINSCIRNGYRERRISLSDPDRLDAAPEYHAGDMSLPLAARTYGLQAKGSSPFMSIVGVSGSGKSSALGIISETYPQVIYHHFEGYPAIPQVTYLIAQAMPNGNLQGLLINIAKSLDTALGNHACPYGKTAGRLNRLKDLTSFICDILEQFAVGVVILDEVQELDANSNRATSYEHFLTISNQTKCPFILVGTEAAVAHLTQTKQLMRRFPAINTSAYCTDGKCFTRLVTSLFRYQWFEPQVMFRNDEFSLSIVKAFLECTGGVVGILILLYQKMCLDYIDQSVKPEITPEYIRHVARKYMDSIRRAFPGFMDPLALPKPGKIPRRESEAGMPASLPPSMVEQQKASIKEQQAREAFIGDNDSVIRDHEAMLANVIKNIAMVTPDYNPETIENAFRKVAKRKAAAGYREEDFTRETMSLLKKSHSDKRHTPYREKVSESCLDDILNNRNQLIDQGT